MLKSQHNFSSLFNIEQKSTPKSTDIFTQGGGCMAKITGILCQIALGSQGRGSFAARVGARRLLGSGRH